MVESPGSAATDGRACRRLSRSLVAQAPPPIWAGVYTAAQAERGRSVVEAHCGECHHDDLSGGEGPALVGSAFMVKWEMQSVERLFHKIRDTMPEVGNTEVTNAQKLDTVAYILQQNGFPAGSTELTDTTGSLAGLQMLPEAGAGPRARARSCRLSAVCRKHETGWVLAGSTDPQVTTRDPLSPADKEALSAAAPGTGTIELIGIYPGPNWFRTRFS